VLQCATIAATLQQSLQHALQEEIDRIRQTLDTDANHCNILQHAATIAATRTASRTRAHPANT